MIKNISKKIPNPVYIGSAIAGVIGFACLSKYVPI